MIENDNTRRDQIDICNMAHETTRPCQVQKVADFFTQSLRLDPIDSGGPGEYIWPALNKPYDSFSDVGENRVYFASKILTPCRMH